jgi:hypothetical protein
MPEVIKEIRRLRRKRKGMPRCTYKKVADEMNASGFKTMTAKPFTGQVVQNIHRKLRDVKLQLNN